MNGTPKKLKFETIKRKFKSATWKFETIKWKTTYKGDAQQAAGRNLKRLKRCWNRKFETGRTNSKTKPASNAVSQPNTVQASTHHGMA